MLDYIKEIHANTLDKLGVVLFYDDDGFLYEIYESDNGGYMVDCYAFDDDTRELIDGGLCTGKSIDAIEFCLPQN